MTSQPSPCRPASVLLTLALCSYSGMSAADFIKDSRAEVELRNMYLNRDFRQHGAPEKIEDWAQGFTLRLHSGYTEGKIAFGLDARATMGLKLDSARGRSGSGVIAVNDRGEPESEWSRLNLTARMKVSETVLRVGALQPLLPVIRYNDTRLLAGSYSGALLTSQEWDGLTLHAGRIKDAMQRDSTGRDDISYAGVSSDHFDLLGGAYQVNEKLTLSYYHGRMQDLYRQHFIGLVHESALTESVRLRTDLRYFHSRDTGAAKAGAIDNDFFNGMFTLGIGGHGLGLGFQRLSGDGNFPFPDGSDPYSVNLVTYNTFAREGTDAWQARYSYDFAAKGFPGLTFMTRYVKADGIRAGNSHDGREWERDTDLTYVFQSGPLQGLSLQWRNLSFRSGGGLKTDIDENRLIVGYTLPLF